MIRRCVCDNAQCSRATARKGRKRIQWTFRSSPPPCPACQTPQAWVDENLHGDRLPRVMAVCGLSLVAVFLACAVVTEARRRTQEQAQLAAELERRQRLKEREAETRKLLDGYLQLNTLMEVVQAFAQRSTLQAVLKEGHMNEELQTQYRVQIAAVSDSLDRKVKKHLDALTSFKDFPPDWVQAGILARAHSLGATNEHNLSGAVRNAFFSQVTAAVSGEPVTAETTLRLVEGLLKQR